jgi:hypothetical protein
MDCIYARGGPLNEISKKTFFRRFFNLTTVEKHFIKLLQRTATHVNRSLRENVRIILLTRRRIAGKLDLLVSVGGYGQDVKIITTGIKPVCYMVITENTELGRKIKKIFSLALGQENLNARVSTESDTIIALFYNIYYPDRLLRSLGL